MCLYHHLLQTYYFDHPFPAVFDCGGHFELGESKLSLHAYMLAFTVARMLLPSTSSLPFSLVLLSLRGSQNSSGVWRFFSHTQFPPLPLAYPVTLILFPSCYFLLCGFCFFADTWLVNTMKLVTKLLFSLQPLLLLLIMLCSQLTACFFVFVCVCVFVFVSLQTPNPTSFNLTSITRTSL